MKHNMFQMMMMMMTVVVVIGGLMMVNVDGACTSISSTLKFDHVLSVTKVNVNIDDSNAQNKKLSELVTLELGSATNSSEVQWKVSLSGKGDPEDVGGIESFQKFDSATNIMTVTVSTKNLNSKAKQSKALNNVAVATCVMISSAMSLSKTSILVAAAASAFALSLKDVEAVCAGENIKITVTPPFGVNIERDGNTFSLFVQNEPVVTKSPTSSPTTKAPTTKAPTKSPTSSPTTKAPTTKAPTKSPTSSPTSSPTTRLCNNPPDCTTCSNIQTCTAFPPTGDISPCQNPGAATNGQACSAQQNCVIGEVCASDGFCCQPRIS